MASQVLAQREVPLIKLLLVEDTPSDAYIVESLLDEIGVAEYHVYHAGSQADAMRLVAAHSFDVCLLDLTLPDANDFSALSGLQEKAPDMPVLILTGVHDMVLARLAVARGAQDYLLKDDLRMASLGRAIDYAIERKRTEKNLFERANYDELTGLANRNMLENRLSMALSRAGRTGKSVALLFLDLDRFKPINDEFGHDAGDQALKTVAQRLKQSLRAYDTPARFGGDEFAVLLEGISSFRDAATIAQKIILAVGEPIPCRGKSYSLGASIGISFAHGQASSEMMLQHADAAMYCAKKEGGNAYRFYSPEMHHIAQSRLKMEEDLRVALVSEELRLHYQPLVSMESGALLGVEALLRWANPERGLMEPEAFIPDAESARMMGEISAWIGGQLRHDIAMWNAQMIPPMQVAVNIAMSQIDDDGFIDWITPLARQDFLGRCKLAVEIPEEALISPGEERFSKLKRLGAMGIALHLDHFGRGALCLQTLLSLPFVLLKLDLSLVQNMVDQLEGDVLVNAAIMLAHHVDMKVAAVGVEIPWQRERLAERQCDILQGYLVAPPMPAREFSDWLNRKNR